MESNKLKCSVKNGLVALLITLSPFYFPGCSKQSSENVNKNSTQTSKSPSLVDKLRAPVPKGWTSQTRKVEVATPQGDESRNITYYKWGNYGIEFVLIPSGEFMMGNDRSYENEGPAHRVRITKPFYMGAYEITQAQYFEIMGANPSRFQRGGDYPVDNVEDNAAMHFGSRLSDKLGMVVRLPTEAEWEYACRAGSTTKFYFGNDRLEKEKYTRILDVYDEPHSIGWFKPNAGGLYDMHGNVFEWCSDQYDKEYYKHGPVDDPRGPEKNHDRPGTWRGVESSNRGYSGCGWGTPHGLRIVVAPLEKK